MMLALAAPIRAQGAATVYVQESTPAAPPNGAIWIQPSSGTVKFVATTEPLTWATAAGGGGEAVPAGANILIDSGTCPEGYTENTALNGKTLIGTLAANGNVGTTGGSDTITPAGTNTAVSAGTPAGTNSAPTFTGNAWSAPAISWPAGVPTFSGTPFSDVINHTHPVTDPGHTHLTQRYPTATGSSSGFTIDTSMSGTLADNTLPTKAATTGITTNNPAGGVASITPAGTVAWPAGVPTIGAYTPTGSVSAPTFTGSALGTHSHTFTGTQFDNRSAFAYVIVCTKS